VITEEDSYGSKSGNGSWNGMVAQVNGGVADIGISMLYITKERSEVVAFTDTLGFLR
jgi:ABC-type amino acid transport substrate-binding protein